MFTPSDIFVLILIVGSGIFIWVARRSGSDHRDATSNSHNHEAQHSAEQTKTHGEKNNHIDHDQAEKKEARSNDEAEHY